MNKIGLLLLSFAVLLQPLVCVAQEEDPSEVFLKAYMTAQQAEKLERENQFKPALSKLRFAGSLLEEVKKTHPDWQPAIVEYRGRKIGEAILRVQSKMATQTDFDEATESAAAPPEAGQPAPAAEPSVDLGTAANASPAANRAAIEQATRALQDRVDSLESELKKSQSLVSAAQRDKSDLRAQLDETTSRLEQAKSEAARSARAEQAVRDQLDAAQKSLAGIQSSASPDQKAALAVKAEITQLRGALKAAETARAAAEEESSAAKRQLADAKKTIASVTRERESMQHERDDALRQLQAANEAQTRVQQLVTENSDLKQKLASAEKKVRDLSAEGPRKAQELAAVKQELEKLRDQLVASQRQNQESDKTIADLRAQLDELSGELANAKLSGTTPDETEKLVKENEMLRAIVVRERQEEARREQAKKLMLAEFDKLKIKSDVLDKQIHLLAEPITKLSPEELALLKTPVVSISDTHPGSIKASLTMAQPESSVAPLTISNPPAAKNTSTPPGSAVDQVANGSGSQIGPEVDTTFKPGVPHELLPLARQAKADFESGKFRQAEKDYQEILAKTPNNLYSLSNLGVVYFRGGKLKAAELTLKKALAIAPRDEFAHTTLGIVYYRQSKFDDALSELTKSLAINPKSATAHNYLGITASQKGWQEAAEKEMLEAIANDPDYADAQFNLAVIYATSQPPARELARRHYQKALALGAEPDPIMDRMLH